MRKLRNKREIISRRRLSGQIAALAESEPAPGAHRPELVSLLKDALAAGRAEVRRRLDGGGDGLTAAAATAYLIDQIVTSIYEHAVTRLYPQANPTSGDRLCLVAVGGYGRGEMAPFSDVDLLFLYPWKQTPRGEQVVEYLLYLLWDLGLTVGHAARSITECVARAKKDHTICTSLLEARYVTGEQALFVEFRERFAREVIAGGGGEFLAAKLAERDRRHARMGDSRYVLEPNVKDGKGGLRDLHTLFWIAKFLYRVEEVGELVARGVLTSDELNKFARAHRFLWTVRCHLHYLSGRAEERLTFDLQPALAEKTRYADRAGAIGVERFMKHYYLVAKDIGDLTRIFCAALEADHRRRMRLKIPWIGRGGRDLDGFRVDHGRLNLVAETDFETDPVRMISLFRVAQRQELDIHPHALRLITRNLKRIDERLRGDERANRLFMAILTSRKDPETALRRMNEAGVLGRFIPDFGRVVAQTQHDMYHVFTVDEHTLFAIGILACIERGELADDLPLASEIVHDILSRKALYLALFLHDIAKGRGGDHSRIGARVASKLGPRFGLSRQDTETVSWLVRHHLLFSNTAFKRDLGDPRTMTDFLAAVQSLERLRLLLVLTVADIRAVGPNVWNGWKGQLLRGLYHEAAAEVSGGRTRADRSQRVAAAKDALRPLLADWAGADIEAHLGRGYPSYWLSFDAETHARHARLIAKADRDRAPLALETRVDRFRAVTEITLYCPDHHGLFAGIAGAMAVCGASIADARIFTTTDGMALDTFWIQNAEGGAFDRPDRLAKLARTIEQTLSRDFKPAEALAARRSLPSRTEVFEVVPRVLIDNKASATYTVIEVDARDRPALLYDITRPLVALRLSVGSARITTFGERAVDVFYVKDMFGMKVTQDARLDEIRATLLGALGAPPPLSETRAAAGDQIVPVAE